jgi:hypothetical protein
MCVYCEMPVHCAGGEAVADGQVTVMAAAAAVAVIGGSAALWAGCAAVGGIRATRVTLTISFNPTRLGWQKTFDHATTTHLCLPQHTNLARSSM